MVGLALNRAPGVTRDDGLQVFAPELRSFGIVGPDFVHLSRTSGAAAGPLATVSRGFWGPGDSEVVEAIRRKEELLPAYAAAIPLLEEHWLLLVAGDGYEQATDSVMSEWTRVPTGFTRVYLMDLRTGALQRVDADQAK